MNLQTNQKGFTIVELLIVIVVIAILAAISIVAYTGIQNNARASAAASAAASVRDTVEAFNANHGVYPLTKAEMVSGLPASGATETAVSKLPSDITFGTPAASANPKTVTVTRYPASGAITGYRIDYFDYKNGNVTTTSTNPSSISVGDTSGTGAALAN